MLRVMNWDIYAKCDISVSFPKSYIRLMRLLDCQGIFMYKIYHIRIFGGLVNNINIAKVIAGATSMGFFPYCTQNRQIKILPTAF